MNDEERDFQVMWRNDFRSVEISMGLNAGHPAVFPPEKRMKITMFEKDEYHIDRMEEDEE